MYSSARTRLSALNPLGLTDSVTQGIISATGRTVGAGDSAGSQPLITAAIQTSAAINPGNSGGARLEQLELVLAELKPGTMVTIRYTRGQGGRARAGTAKLGSLAS